ncbi:MAG: hypothetical protein ACYC1Z_04170 [Georgenia sp.]
MTTPSTPPGETPAGEPAPPRHLDEGAAWDEAAVAAREAHEMDSTAVRRRSLMGMHDPAVEHPTGAAPVAPTSAAAAPPGDGPRPGGAEPGAPTAEDPRSAALRARMQEAANRPGTVLDGATEARPITRSPAHVWGLVLTLLLTPIAWYLWVDAGARLTLVPDAPWETGVLNVAALAELAAAILVTVVVLLAARWSSVGAILVGSLVLLGGLAFVALPLRVQDVLGPGLDRAADLGGLGVNIGHHLLADGAAGRFVLYGTGLVLVGVVSHGARRLGRAEERTRAETTDRVTAPTHDAPPRHGSRLR